MIYILLEHCFHLIVYVLSCESELLIKDLVWGRETETLKTEYLTVASDKTLKVYRKTCCETEDLRTVRKNGLLILLRLIAEEALRWAADYTYLKAILTEKFCTCLKSRDL